MAVTAQDLLLIFTLDGKFTLVNRSTGDIWWTYDSELVNNCTYSADVVVIPEIHGGQLYEYSNNSSSDLLYRINSSIFEMIARSPESLNSLYSTGYKSDHWFQLDLDTGRLLKSAQCLSPYRCYASNIDDQYSKRRTLVIGMSEYHFLLWDLVTGVAKLNMTHQSLPLNMDLDRMTSNLTHIVTLEPSIVTFEEYKFRWHLPLSAPVVDLFSVEALPPPLPTNTGQSAEMPDPVVLPSTAQFLPVPVQTDAQYAEQSHRLRRILFTTHALFLNQSYAVPHYPTQSALWEEKLSHADKFVSSLYLGETNSSLLYIIHTLAEAVLNPRHVHRVAEHLRLAYESRLTDGPNHFLITTRSRANVFWPESLIGLYHLSLNWPQVNLAWSSPLSPPHHLQLVNDPLSDRPLRPLLSMQDSDIRTTSLSKELRTILWTSSTTIVLIIFATLTLYLRLRNRTRHYRHYQTPWDHSSSLLHPSFDCADSEGWAGHPVTSTEVAQNGRTDPEVVRFNLRRVLGSGANGTTVFEGIYGEQVVAVKRILRRAELEKSWLREHRILVNHHHEHLIRCFWTGTSPNFHYLVLQRCAISLLEVFDTEEGVASSERKDDLSRFGLSPLQCVYQLLNAMVFLHSKSIVHRDIKPTNIFIVEAPSTTTDFASATATTVSNRLVLGDFGLSLPLDNGLFDNSICIELPDITTAATENVEQAVIGGSAAFNFGSLGWMAPEMCAPSKEALTQSVDVFAFGLVAHFILSLGGHPFFSPSTKTVAKPCRLRHIYTSLVSLQSMQKRINDFQLPSLHDLTNCICEKASETGEQKPDKMRSCLAQLLIKEALTFDASKRSPIEVLASSPLFWSPESIMAFYTDVSNFMDESKPTKFASGSSSLSPEWVRSGGRSEVETTAVTSVDDYRTARQCLSTSLDAHWAHVFSGSWLRHLDTVLVEDLCSIRSYQDKSLTQLLRAIRNKRNHIWSLRSEVHKVLGSTDTAMAQHWNSRFPSLLPLTYCLARVHLAEVDQFRRFLPAPLTLDDAECFICDHCSPSKPAMWVRLSTPEHGSPLQSRPKVSASNNSWLPPSVHSNSDSKITKDSVSKTTAAVMVDVPAIAMIDNDLHQDDVINKDDGFMPQRTKRSRKRRVIPNLKRPDV